MKPLNILQSTFVPISLENIDTDQIVPARFLKATTKEGFGKFLFRDWRFLNDNELTPKPNFPLNNSAYKGEILVVGKNFGSGSSREHAAWAILDYGFRVVVSSFFADIFKNNALNNGVLPVQISEAFLQKIFNLSNTSTLTIQVETQTITIDETGEQDFYEINNYKKTCLIKGYDDIDFLISVKNDIKDFEKRNRTISIQ